MMSQENITPATPLGATIVDKGATFRVWAPRAEAVYLNPDLAPDGGVQLTDARRMQMQQGSPGYWTAFEPDAGDGFLYRYYVIGTGAKGYKRDPYARELKNDVWPDCSSIVRGGNSYPWHDAGFVTPDFSELVIYQFHIGAFAISQPGVPANFLDVIGKLEYLADLGANMLQPLPIDQQGKEAVSLGYSGADIFSPDFPYVCTDAAALPAYLSTINGLLRKKDLSELTLANIASGIGQLKALVDLAHVFGIAVAFDVVYGHGGGFEGDDNAYYYMDRFGRVGADNNESLYCTNKSETPGLAFALWQQPVAQFLRDNTAYFLKECHADGFRYDQVSDILDAGLGSAWDFCRSLTSSVRSIHPRALQNAEFWPGRATLPESPVPIVTSADSGGAGFDVVQHDLFRNAARTLIKAASGGASAPVSVSGFAPALYPPVTDQGWRAVTCLENHDIVYVGHTDAVPRIPALADAADHRSWYARSRTRVATSLLLLAPGIPQLFMGQEFLEDKLWSEDPKATGNLLWWDGLHADPAMGWQLRCTRDLLTLRKAQPGLRGDSIRAFCTDDYARVLAFHRWVEGSGEDIIVVASLSETTQYGYSVGFPFGGLWKEIFNSDVYDNWVNPKVAGNSRGITAGGPPLHGFTTSAALTLPANGVVVFTRG